MPESYGITYDAAKNVIKQLFARNTEVKARHCTLAAGTAYKRGCLVFAATPDANFTQVLTAALPAATDLLGIVTEDVDATGGALKAAIYTSGEYVADAVWAASGAIDAAGKLAATEAGMRQGINLIPAAYGDIAGSF
jgi:hypothetical protein